MAARKRDTWDRIFVAALSLWLATPAIAALEATCLPPAMEVEISLVTQGSNAAGDLSPVLHLVDPNPEEQVSGYNIHRAPEASFSPGLWSLLAVDVVDQDATTPGVQWSDESGDVAPSGIWYYLAAAYNGPCAAEGPWNPAPADDIDGDGTADADDPCPTTPEGAAPVTQGCSATDLLLRPEVVVAPTADGLAAFLAPDDTAPTPMPDNVRMSLESAVAGLTRVFDDLRGAAPCSAATGFASVLGGMDNATLFLQEYLVELGDTGGGPGAPGAESHDPDGTEGPIRWPSDEILWWRGKLLQLGLLRDGAADGSDVTAQVCESAGDPVALMGRVRRVMDEGRQLELFSGERVVVSWIAAIGGRQGMAKDYDVAIDGVDYGEGILGTGLTTSPSPYPFIPGLSYDFCLELRIAPVQPLPGYPYWQSGWELHRPGGYMDTGGILSLEEGVRLAALDSNCPGILPGAGPSGENLRLDYYFELLLDYKPKQGNQVNGATLANELTGASAPLSLPDMDATVTAMLTANKWKRTCLDSGLSLPVIDPMSGNVVGTQTVWNCSPPQLVSTTLYPTRVSGKAAYCIANYGASQFDLEDHQPADWRQTTVTGVATPGSVPPPLTFSAIGDPIVGGQPVHNQPVGLNQAFAIYGPFGHAHLGLGTTHRAFLDWPHIAGSRNGEPFRYSCQTPRLITDRIAPCSGTDTYLRGPYPSNTLFQVYQGNGGSYSHNGWQWYALDLSGSEGTPIRAARGGTVIKVRKDMSLNCKLVTCPNFGWPLLDEYGSHVAIQHQDGTVAWYAHMVPFSATVSLNQKVKRGDHIGNIGNTGNSTGAHLHIHVTPEDPSTWTNTTILSRYEAFSVADTQVQTCFVPLDDHSYVAINQP